MVHRTIVVAFLLLALSLSGCSSKSNPTNTPLVSGSVYGSLTTYKKEPYKSYVNESEITKTDTIFIYHIDGYVTKIVFSEESVLNNSSDIEDLKNYAKVIDIDYAQEKFQINGFSYSMELTNKSLLLTTKLDFTEMNIKEALDKIGSIFYLNEFADKNDKVLYKNVVEFYSRYGFFEDESNP